MIFKNIIEAILVCSYFKYKIPFEVKLEVLELGSGYHR